MTRKSLLAVFAAVCLIAGISVSVWAEKQHHMRAALESLMKARALMEEGKRGIEYDNTR